MMKLFFLVLSAVLVAVALYHSNQSYLRTEINAQSLLVPAGLFSDFPQEGVRVAVVGDLHVRQSSRAYEDLSTVVDMIQASKPELILLLGDYTATPNSVSDMDNHRSEVAKRLSLLTSVPVAAVLGNYETWSGISDWKKALSEAGITALHNEVETINVKGKDFCVRGLGDTFTNQFRELDFPDICSDLPKVTITHDPAGAFKPDINGVIFAAHTHCGQVRVPGVGALWVPTEAPRQATCGFYQDATRVLWVTSGVGTSILPMRLGAQSQWDLLTLIAE